ncbi:hypothetical protein [Paraburkholderia caballeronis]|uniref:hypothetical protein n=1 Tax=Paraburkholderia caballeronis TaxID=416943 RepID=UPI001065AE6E|nr:hypothetical protein [Paraburkholderia caballeronis]TDV04648.1 hypothetical protein C7408_13110 [Paraburkholderia caballeronis]TDV07891.1 hypothetical protein C7406_13310 [Paraburkholderia caballeronis]TDV18182.1 hypothetical protein C7404_13110 [Paraburkholderia caballeronis]
MTNWQLWEALRRIEHHRDLSDVDRNLLRPAFAGMNGGQAMRLPDRIIARIRYLEATLPRD